ncbi:MAG: EAL domain-containing protein [Treponema sp.]|nr:EAL domain-containing protein [Treponema sp.]
MKKIHYIFILLPYVSVLFGLLLNPIFHWIFYYDENKIYSHGAYMPLLYVMSFLYLLTTIFFTIKYFKALNQTKRMALVSFIAFSIIPIIIQIFYEHLLISIFCQSLGILGVLLSIDNENEIINQITGIYNRYSFIQDTEASIKTGIKVNFTVIKIAELDYYNSTFGLKFVIELQKRTIEKLKLIDKNATPYDCDSGHFVLLRYNSDQASDKLFIEKISKCLEQEQSINGLQTTVHAQLTLINLPEDKMTLDQILMNIDIPISRTIHKTALIQDDTFRLYHREMIIEKQIRKSLDNKTLTVTYQPIYDTKKKQIKSAEALVRLKDSELGYISPEEFIPICEKNGLILQLGEFVFDCVCRDYINHKLDNYGIDYIEVNLSVVQCMNTELIDTFEKIIKKYGIESSRINLEITESAAVSNQKILSRTINGLQNLGFTFSMDDYGTGYSNYSYMYSLPFSIIKLDKSILWQSQENINSYVLLSSTIEMLHKMNYHIVCEGVETQEQKNLLEKLNCDYLQGFFFSKAISIEEFIQYVVSFNN